MTEKYGYDWLMTATEEELASVFFRGHVIQRDGWKETPPRIQWVPGWFSLNE